VWFLVVITVKRREFTGVFIKFQRNLNIVVGGLPLLVEEMKADQHGNLVKVIAYALIILHQTKNRIFQSVQTVPVVSDEKNLVKIPKSSTCARFEHAQRRYKQQQERERDLERSSIILERNLRAFYNDHTYTSKNSEFKHLQKPQQLLVEQAMSVTSSSSSLTAEVISAEVG